jgi:hypothetical protein
MFFASMLTSSEQARNKTWQSLAIGYVGDIVGCACLPQTGDVMHEPPLRSVIDTLVMSLLKDMTRQGVMGRSDAIEHKDHYDEFGRYVIPDICSISIYFEYNYLFTQPSISQPLAIKR